MNKKKCILLVLSGLADRAQPVLEHRTPLQVARTPVLDTLASLGSCGFYHPGDMGVAMSSVDAHFAMFGYSSSEFPGRGYIEALGSGIRVEENEINLSARLVPVQRRGKELYLQKENDKVSTAEAAALAADIEEWSENGYSASFIRTRGCKGIVRFSGDVDRFITDSHPFIEGQALMEPQPWEMVAALPAAKSTSSALKRFLLHCYEILQQHPVNISRMERGDVPFNGLVTFCAGRKQDVEPFGLKWGLKGLSLSAGRVYSGLAKYMGMDVISYKDSKDWGEDLTERLQVARQKLDLYDFIHVHTRGPANAAHRKDPFKKIKIIESLDKSLEIVEEILKDNDVTVMITADHSTPSSGGLIHSGEPVPLLIAGSGTRRDIVEHFDEIQCSQGALGQTHGNEIMYLALNSLDRSKLKGLMDAPENRPYWPGSRKPFILK